MSPSRTRTALLAAALVVIALGHAAAAATLYVIDKWDVPDEEAEYPPINATCGDVIQFVWPAEDVHGVWRLNANVSGPGGACPPAWNASVGVELAPEAAGGNYNFTVPNSPGAHWLACPVNRHCDRGQKVLVLVECPPGGGVAAAPAAEPGAGLLVLPTGGAGAPAPEDGYEEMGGMLP